MDLGLGIGLQFATLPLIGGGGVPGNAIINPELGQTLVNPETGDTLVNPEQ